MGASVLIVDDHPGFRTQARRMLECEGYRVIGEAGDVASGLEAAPAVVLTSSHDGVDLAPCVAESGARGFVAKAELSRAAIEGVLG